jgi:hypothetical protein
MCLRVDQTYAPPGRERMHVMCSRSVVTEIELTLYSHEDQDMHK